MGHRTPTAVCEERPSSSRARPRALRRLRVAVALGAALVVAALAAPAAPAAPLTAHLGAADVGLSGIATTQARCQPKGLFGFGFPSGAGTLSPGTYFYVVKPLGTTLPFTCTPIPVGVAPAGPGENANDSAFIQWLPTPAATGYEVYRGTSPATMARIATLTPAQAQCLTAVRCAFFDRNQNAPSTPFPGPGFPGALEQAGSHPDFRIVQRVDYGGTNNNAPDPNTPIQDRSLTREPFSCGAPAPFPQSFQNCATTQGTNEALRTDLLRFPDGLIASSHATRNPAATDAVVKCQKFSTATEPRSLLGDPNKQGSQDPNEDTCPKESLVGVVSTITRVPNTQAAINAGAPFVRLSASDGEIYNAVNEGTEAGRLFVVIHPLCSAGYPQPFNPGSTICNVLVPPPNGTTVEVKKEFQAGIANIVPTAGANGQYHIESTIVDEITGGDIENFQQVLVSPGGGPFVEPPNARIPRQVRLINQTLFGYAQQNTDTQADDQPFMTLPTSPHDGSAQFPFNQFTVDKTEFDDPGTVATSPPTDGNFRTLNDLTTPAGQPLPFQPGLVSEVDTNQAEAPVSNATTVALCPDPAVKNCTTTNDPIHQSHVHTVTALFPKGLVVNAAAGNDIKNLGAVIGDVAGNSEELGALGGDIKLIRVNDDGSFVIQAEVRPKETPDQVVPLEFVVTPDPQTGQLRAEDDNAPQVPFTNLELRLGGAGIPKTLVNPPTSGQNITDVELGPWSGGPVVGVDDSFETVGGPTATAAVRAQAADDRPFSPTISAKVDPSTANQDGNMALHIEKQDRQQNLKGFSLHLPSGLLANLGALHLCPAAQADTGDCDAASQIGTVDIGSGNGPNPLHLPGQVFITDPLVAGDVAGMVVKVVASVGPFNLGTVLTKSRLVLDASRLGVDVQTVGDFPTILKGIPVRIRSIDLNINGLRNPVTCDARQFAATFTSQGDPTTSRTAAEGGATSDSTAPYAATGCENLGFTPKLTSVIGSNSQPASVNSHPPVSTVVTQPDHEAAISSSTVSLPVGLNANIAALANTCSRDQLNADACPAASKVGDASAASPLIPTPLAGPMYLVENAGGLPKLVVKLSGLISQQLEASSSLVNGRVVTTFTGLPATPVSRFELNIAGGPNGLFTVGNELCAPRTIDGTFNSHTGQTANVSSPVQFIGNCVPVNASATSRRPRLSVRVSGVRRSPVIRIVARKATEGSANLSTLRVVLPSQFSVRNVRRGISVTAGGRRLGTRNWSLSRSRVLTVRGLPKAGRSIITATIRSSAIRAGRSLRSLAVRGRTLPRVTFSSRIVDVANARFTFRTRVRPGR